jgi:two-component system, sensor histidine kinase PdtaS
MILRKTLACLLVILCQFAFASDSDTILATIEQTEDPLEKSELYIKLGDTYEYSDPSTALLYFRKAYETAHSVSMSSSQRSLSPEADYLKAKSLRYMGFVHSDQGNFDEALELFFEAKSILDNLKDLYTTPFRDKILLKTGKVLNNIGVVYSRQGVFSVAKEYYAEALGFYIELQDSTSIAVAYSSMGIAEARMANLTEALKFFQQALDIYTANAVLEGMGQSYNNIGGIHFQMSNWDEALKLYNKAHDIYSEMKFNQRVAAIKSNIGLVYQKKEEYDKAMEFLQSSLKMRLELNDQVGIVESNNNIGNLLSARHDHRKANEHYQNSYQMATAIGDQRMIAVSLTNIGKEYFLGGQKENAISNTLKGLEVARNHKLKFEEQLALKQLSEIYAEFGDYKNGYEYSTAHYLLSQEILNEQKARQINELEIEFKARENQQRIEYLEQDSEFQRVKLNQSRTITLILALLFLTGLIITIFTLILFRQRNRILILKKENEAERAIRLTDNNLQAILKTHAHAMILFDDELNVLSFNAKASQWMEKFIGLNLNENLSFNTVEHKVITELVNDTMQESLKGYSREVEKEMIRGDEKYHYKFFCNPVFENDDEMIQSISLMIENVSERRNTEEKILSDLKEKETLIKEIHHRVKNNMQVIISLIRMQSRHFSNQNLIESFTELEQRIAAMSYVHEDLYKSANLADIKFDDYLRRISSNLSGVYGSTARVYNHIDMQNQYINIDVAMPCGLVINEVVTNALKHAFLRGDGADKKDNKIDIYFTENPLNYELKIADNGVGMPTGIDPHKTSSMGFHLIKIIVEEQLHGNWNTRSSNGLTVSISFPKR